MTGNSVVPQQTATAEKQKEEESSMPIRILAIGDIVGRRSVRYIGERLRKLRDRLSADFTVVNGENAAEIHGISVQDAEDILAAGADLITLGNHAFGQRDIGTFLDDHPDRIIRPANFPAQCPGMGRTYAEVRGRRMLCVNLSGTVHMDELDNPFTAMERILAAEKGKYDIAMLDFHAEATSEKAAMGRFLDGRVQIVFGTHTHVATADETVLPGGTGYITDLGMTGPDGGVIGTEARAVLYRMTTRMPTRFSVAGGNVVGHGALFTLSDTAPYACLRTERIVF